MKCGAIDYPRRGTCTACWSNEVVVWCDTEAQLSHFRISQWTQTRQQQHSEKIGLSWQRQSGSHATLNGAAVLVRAAVQCSHDWAKSLALDQVAGSTSLALCSPIHRIVLLTVGSVCARTYRRLMFSHHPKLTSFFTQVASSNSTESSCRVCAVSTKPQTKH